MSAYRILTFDGGGIRGLYSAVLLRRLAAAVPGFLGKVDLVAGTSTGGIIALGLARGLRPTALVQLYRTKGHRIFDDSWLDDLLDLGQLCGAEYDNRQLRDILRQALGAQTKLRQLGKHVVIPTFDLDNEGADGQVQMWKPKFFHNFPGPKSDGKELAVDVALRTCAAPTYFPSYQGYVDGGVVANNPSMAAVAQAIDPETGGKGLEDIHLLSIGTGLNPTYIEGDRLDWGFSQWVKPLIQLMIDGVMGVADYQCDKLLGQRYHRLAPCLPKAIGLDEWRKADALVKYAERAGIAKTVRWLKNSFLADD